MVVYLGIGGNIGVREAFLNATKRWVVTDIGRITRESSIYETEAWGMSGNDFLNQVIEIETNLDPEAILKAIGKIERKLGRKRKGTPGYASRTADIDILLYGSEVLKNSQLEIPHPGIAQRKFVLLPLCELVGEAMHPSLQKSFNQLKEECADTTAIQLWNSRTAT